MQKREFDILPQRIREIAEEWGVTPENSLDATTNDIAFPTYAGRTDNHCCDTDLWRELAHEIVPDETLSDSVKLTMLHERIFNSVRRR